VCAVHARGRDKKKNPLVRFTLSAQQSVLYYCFVRGRSKTINPKVLSSSATRDELLTAEALTSYSGQFAEHPHESVRPWDEDDNQQFEFVLSKLEVLVLQLLAKTALKNMKAMKQDYQAPWNGKATMVPYKVWLRTMKKVESTLARVGPM